RRHLMALQIRPQPEGVADRNPVVAQAMDHQHRRADVANMQAWGIGQPAARVDVWGTELVLTAGPKGGHAVLVLERPQTGVTDDGTETICVTGNPVGHVATERTAQCRSA